MASPTESGSAKRGRGRPASKPVTDPDQLGTMKAVAEYAGVGEHYIYMAHDCAKLRHAPDNRNFVRGGKTTRNWFYAWLDRNADFRVTMNRSPHAKGLATQ